MSKDSVRSDLSLELSCSKCGETMTGSIDKSKVHGSSAMDLTMVMAIHPCVTCLREAEKPGLLFKQALGMLEKS